MLTNRPLPSSALEKCLVNLEWDLLRRKIFENVKTLVVHVEYNKRSKWRLDECYHVEEYWLGAQRRPATRLRWWLRRRAPMKPEGHTDPLRNNGGKKCFLLPCKEDYNCVANVVSDVGIFTDG